VLQGGSHRVKPPGHAGTVWAAPRRAAACLAPTEARIGAELKAAQERGEVARRSPGNPQIVRAADDLPANHVDIGIPRQRAAEMKKLAAMGEPRIRDEVAAATRERRAPSRRLMAWGTGALPKWECPTPVPQRLRQLSPYVSITYMMDRLIWGTGAPGAHVAHVFQRDIPAFSGCA
jgi:hypothetical protein